MTPQQQVQELLGRIFSVFKKEDNAATILIALMSGFMGHAKASIEMAPKEAIPVVKKLLDNLQKFVAGLEQEGKDGQQ